LSAERLQKVLASAGIASRRDCEELIAAGRVAVNGKVMHVLGARVDLDHDEITVDGRPIGKINPRTYVMLHKPAGVVSTADDPQGRLTVVEMVDLPGRLFPVGRLDYDSEGLLLLTDDGELTQRLTHPSYEIEKEYRALLDQPPSPDALREWRTGVILDSAPTAPAWVDVEERDEHGTWVRVVLHEGRKRQIRAVAGQLGYNVLRLIRVREGPLTLGDLPSGEWRQLTDEEVELLWQHVGGRDAPPPVEVAPPERQRERGAGPDERPRRRFERGGDADRRPRGDQRMYDDRPPRNPAPDDQASRPRRDDRAPLRRADERAPARRDERPRRDERAPTRRDERRGDYRPARRDERAPTRRDERPYEARRDERRDERPRRDERAPTRRDERRGDYRPARRDERAPTRRDERPYEARRDERRGDYRPARRDERAPTRRDERPQRDDFDSRHREGPEPGNERRPDHDERQEKRGPSREWHARQAQEQRGRKQRGPTQRWNPRGGTTRRTGVFRPKTSKEREDES
jgi:23S rRNA pseudouridine2605 synthase